MEPSQSFVLDPVPFYTIEKEFAFEAAHSLPHLPPTHQCSRPHGHSYRVRVQLQAHKLDERGFVVDYGDLSPLKDLIDEKLDHRDLNQVLPVSTTAENLAYFLYQWCKERWPETLVKVGVSETQKTWAWYQEI
jgi:6-pyruvoyltetrahydropterin/6-carboxytetrahydropterin synthase